MENLRPEEENIIKGIRNLFRLKKILNNNYLKKSDTWKIQLTITLFLS